MALPRHQTIIRRHQDRLNPVPPETDEQQRGPELDVPDVRIEVAAPLPHQVDIVEDEAYNKLLQGGRRGGKTRIDVHCGLIGHGPIGHWDGDDQPARRLHRGILTSSFDVAWICPTYKQSDPLWEEEVRPRFANKPHCKVNDTDMYVQVEGLGRLFVRTEENAATLRGQGKRLVGAIFDEAAHMDTETILTDVVLYALMDNNGWMIFSSTTNADLDGNPKKVPPSFFNRLCHEVDQGIRRAPRWRKWHFTAHDNPKIRPDVLATTIEDALTLGGQRRVDQEVYALLLAPGSGLAFPSWKYAIHVRTVNPTEGWGCIGTLDWGSTSPGAFYLLLQGPDGRLSLRCEVYFNGPDRPGVTTKLTARKAGELVGNAIESFCKKHPVWPEFIGADSAMWDITGAGETLATLFQKGLDQVLENRAPQLVPAPKGPGSRRTRKELLSEALYWEEEVVEAADGTKTKTGMPTAEGWPLLAVGEDCPHFARTVPILPCDPLDGEKVDTKGEDHAFDSVTYGLHQLLPEHDAKVAQQGAKARERAQLDTLSRKEAEQFDALERRAELEEARRRRRR